MGRTRTAKRSTLAVRGDERLQNIDLQRSFHNDRHIVINPAHHYAGVISCPGPKRCHNEHVTISTTYCILDQNYVDNFEIHKGQSEVKKELSQKLIVTMSNNSPIIEKDCRWAMETLTILQKGSGGRQAGDKFKVKVQKRLTTLYRAPL